MFVSDITFSCRGDGSRLGNIEATRKIAPFYRGTLWPITESRDEAEFRKAGEPFRSRDSRRHRGRRLDDRTDHRRMNRAMVRSPGGADYHRLTGCAWTEITRVERSVVQHHTMCNSVDVVPHDHLPGGESCRIRREGLRAILADDVNRHDTIRWSGCGCRCRRRRRCHRGSAVSGAAAPRA